MAEHINISKIIQESCEKVEKSASQKEQNGAQPFEIIHSAVSGFFENLTKAGYGYDVSNLLEDWAHQHSQECLNVAHDSLEHFKKSNTALQDITENHAIEIEKIAQNRREINVSFFKARFNDFQQDLLVELENANRVIKDLEDEIEQLQKQAHIDPLTKLLNRKALELDAHEFLKFSHERKLDLVAMMIDADNFKQINDTYGHIAGDKVLILLAKLFLSSIRESDKAYRYGGEEFLILFTRSKLHDVIRVGERIMQTVRDHKIIYKNRTIRLTLSIGLTEHHRGDTLESLIERADAAVYRAKKNGKDQMVVA